MNENPIRLDREKYDYFPLKYRYFSSEHYKARVCAQKDRMALEFVREPLKEPCSFENTDTLFQEYWNVPESYAIFDDDGNMCAVTEFDFEEWNNRMRITQMLVYEPYRKKGLGKKLMDFAKQTALDRDYRMIVVETQSNNTNAIDFYMSQGFVFCGSNVYFYSNDDIGEDEVMIELAFLF